MMEEMEERSETKERRRRKGGREAVLYGGLGETCDISVAAAR